MGRAIWAVVSARRGARICVALAALMLVAAGAGLAVASIPSTVTGKITACVDKSTRAVRIIDYQAGRRCRSGDLTLSWSKGYTYQGAWSAARTYGVLDVVTDNGSSYLAKAGSTGKAPASHPSLWGLLAARGARGPAGVSSARVAAVGDQQDLPDATLTKTLGEQLPAGDWAITVTVSSIGGTTAAAGDSLLVGCQLRNPADLVKSEVHAYLTGSSTKFATTSLTIIGAITIGAGGGEVSVWCQITSAPDQDRHLDGVQLLALQVDSLG